MSRPTFVFVPGAWHSSEIYSATQQTLHGHGYETIALDLPSIGVEPAHGDWNEDVRVIRRCLRQLIEEENKNVILVTHSVNGLTASEAANGLSIQDRKATSLKGGIERMVYIMALAMPEGFRCWPKGDHSTVAEWMKMDETRGVATVTPSDARQIFYNDLNEDEAKHWIAKLKPQSEGVYTSQVTYAAWRHIPSTFVVATEDKSSITKEVVEYMVNQDAPNAFDCTETCVGGGHCLMISQPEWLAGILRRAAREKDVV